MTTIATSDILGRPVALRRFFLAAALLLGVGLAGISGLASADDKDKKVDDSLKEIQGTWVAVENSGFDSTWAFNGDDLKSSVNGTEYISKVTADPKAKPHATVDITIKEGPDESKGKVCKAIYKLDGEKLKLCLALPGRDRPKVFEQADDEAYVFELKKEIKK
jgi:uncharacterized protein (TIGR03067 family)